MSKVSFRARALDSNKLMPVFIADELPDLSEYAAINRAVPAMPTGMEKDEEMELHLQAAINAQQVNLASGVSTSPPSTSAAYDEDAAQQPQSTRTGAETRAGGRGEVVADDHVIPTPKVTPNPGYSDDQLYPVGYRVPKNFIKVQAALNLQPEIADYDLDSDDERWLTSTNERRRAWALVGGDVAGFALNGSAEDDGAEAETITADQFETIVDRLEKASERVVCTLAEIKSVLHVDDHTVQDVYDYWLNKRIDQTRTAGGGALMPRVKNERRDGTTTVNPYVAFRRRAEKIQTRRNRKNDEDSYEKILKISHDLSKAVTLLEMVKRREKSKRELVNLNMEICERRFKMGDFNDEVYSQVLTESKPSFQFPKSDLPKRSKKDVRLRKLLLRQHQQQHLTNISETSPSAAAVVVTPDELPPTDLASSSSTDDEGLVSRSWLAHNAERWHRSPVFPLSPTAAAAAAALHSSSSHAPSSGRPGRGADGVTGGGRQPFVFKRRKGCTYYAPTPLSMEPSTSAALPLFGANFSASRRRGGVGVDVVQPDDDVAAATAQAGFRNVVLRCGRTGELRHVGMMRRRVGRGGRVLFDRLSDSPWTPTAALSAGKASTFGSQLRQTDDRHSASDAAPSPHLSSATIPSTSCYASQFRSSSVTGLSARESADASTAQTLAEVFRPASFAAAEKESSLDAAATSPVFGWDRRLKVVQPAAVFNHSATTLTRRDAYGGGGYSVRAGTIGGGGAASNDALAVRVGVSDHHYEGHREELMTASSSGGGTAEYCDMRQRQLGNGDIGDPAVVGKDAAYHSTAAVMRDERFWTVYGKRIEQQHRAAEQIQSQPPPPRATVNGTDGVVAQWPQAGERLQLTARRRLEHQERCRKTTAAALNIIATSPSAAFVPIVTNGPPSATLLAGDCPDGLPRSMEDAVMQINCSLPTPSPSPNSSRGSGGAAEETLGKAPIAVARVPPIRSTVNGPSAISDAEFDKKFSGGVPVAPSNGGVVAQARSAASSPTAAYHYQQHVPSSRSVR